MHSIIYSILFFLPFDRIPSLELQGITIRVSTLLVVIALGAFLLKIPRLRHSIRLSRIDRWVITYYCVAILSIVFATTHTRSFEVLAFLTFTILAYFLISRSLKKTDPVLLLQVITISALSTGIFGLYQFVADSFSVSQQLTGLSSQYSKAILGFPRVQSVGLEPLYYANFLLLPLFLITTYLAFQKKIPRWYEALTLLIIWIAFLLTVSRGAYAAVIAGMFVLISVFLIMKHPIHNPGRILGISIGAVCIALLAIELSSGAKGVKTFTSHATVTNTHTTVASVTPRLSNYAEAWRLFTTKPILGIGIGNYGVLNMVSPPSNTRGYMIVNNQYLETLAETGILGLMALLGIVYACFTQLWRSLRKKPSWIAFGLLATLCGVLMQYNFLSTIYMLYFWTVLALISAFTEESTSE